MRVFAHFVAVACLAAVAAVVPARGQGPDASKVLAAAREALGGEKKLSAVKSFTATGRTRQVRGENLVPIEFEIAVELPDKYVRKDEIPAQESGPTATGFNGDELIQDPPPSAAPALARPGGPPPPTPAQQDAARRSRVTSVKQDFARLTLGMFAASFASYPLTFTYIGQAEAPQGKAGVLDVKGPANFSMRLFVHSDTHLPIMVSWLPPAGPMRGSGLPPGGRGAARGGSPPTGPMPAGPLPTAPTPTGPMPTGPIPTGPVPGGPVPTGPVPGGPVPSGPVPGGLAPTGPVPSGPAPGAPPAGAATPKPAVENRIYFADYRDVDGLQFPFRIRRAVGSDTVEETTFDRFRINARIDAKRFEVKK